jgi:hypothetical protein
MIAGRRLSVEKRAIGRLARPTAAWGEARDRQRPKVSPSAIDAFDPLRLPGAPPAR